MEIRVRGQTVRTSAEHPFYVLGQGWTKAEHLQPGDRLRSHDGQWISLESVRTIDAIVPVFNMRVAEYHTYFVGDQTWKFSVWAHNAVCVWQVGTASQLQAQSDPFDGIQIHHAPQQHPAIQVITDYDPHVAPAIAVPQQIHQQVLNPMNITGQYNGSVQQLLTTTLNNLQVAGAPPGALQELQQMFIDMGWWTN